MPECAAQTTLSAGLLWKGEYAAGSELRVKRRLVLGANWGGRPWIVNSSEHDGKGGDSVEQTEAGVSESKLKLDQKFVHKLVSEI